MTCEEFIRVMRAGHVHCTLYHFTDAANLASIRRYGLLSKQRLHACRITPDRPGGNDLSRRLDANCGIFDFVSLCLTRNHPMEYAARQDGRILDAHYLRIDANILMLPGVKFAFGVANAAEARVVDLTEALPDVDAEVLYRRTDWHDPEVQRRLRAAEKYEILVPQAIPPEMILDFA